MTPLIKQNNKITERICKIWKWLKEGHIHKLVFFENGTKKYIWKIHGCHRNGDTMVHVI